MNEDKENANEETETQVHKLTKTILADGKRQVHEEEEIKKTISIEKNINKNFKENEEDKEDEDEEEKIKENTKEEVKDDGSRRDY